MTAYYNEIDPYAAQWLRNLIATPCPRQRQRRAGRGRSLSNFVIKLWDVHGVPHKKAEAKSA
jgi:hypothetical protein